MLLMGKSTISMAIFNSKLLVYQAEHPKRNYHGTISDKQLDASWDYHGIIIVHLPLFKEKIDVFIIHPIVPIVDLKIISYLPFGILFTTKSLLNLRITIYGITSITIKSLVNHN